MQVEVSPIMTGPERTNQAQNVGDLLRTYRLALCLVLLKPFGNLSLAWGMRHLPAVLSLKPLLYLRVFLDPFVALGVGMHILWLVMRTSLFSLADLTFVLPVTASGYVLSALLGRFFLREEVTSARWLGIVLLFCGVVVAGSSAQSITEERQIANSS